MVQLYGTLLSPRSVDNCQVLASAVVQIADDGRIGHVGQHASAPAGAVGGPGCWIIPGFIDAHLHLPQWDRRGIDGLTLGQWQEKIGFPAELRLADPHAAEDLAERFVDGMIANGTTTICAFGSPFADEVDRSMAIFARRGLRAIYGMSLNDVGMPPELAQQADRALDESRALAARWHNAEAGRLRYAFSPRSSIRCSEKLMRGSAALADMLQCHLQTHVAQSLEELADLRGQSPERLDEIDLFADVGLLTPRTILAHGVFLGHGQRQQVADAGTSLVHCPTANLFRESGLMDYAAHRAAGIRIALGSSIAGGYEPFMPRVAVEALQTAKAMKVHTLPRGSSAIPTPAEAWWLLTAGAAEALCLDDVGAIEPGRQADCLVVRPETWIAQLPPDQQISALLYTLTPQQIEQVYIAGRRVSA
jgi:guanine deaminase